MEARAADAPERARALDARQTALETEAAQEDRTRDELEHQAKRRAEHLAQLTAALADARTAADLRDAHAAALAELKARHAMLCERADHLAREQARLAGELENLTRTHQSAEREAAVSAGRLATARQRVEQAAAGHEAAEAEANAAHRAQQAQAGDLAAAERRLADHAGRLQTLEAERRALQTAHTARRQAGPSDAALRERAPGVVGRLRELLPDALARNEPLLDTALSDALDDWMIRDRADLSDAVAAVRALDLAPARLRLLETSGAPDVSDAVRADPDVRGSLDAYVKANDPRIRRLLRRVVVVADLDAALRVRAAHVNNGPLPMIVALAGAAIDTDGSIRTGAVSRWNHGVGEGPADADLSALHRAGG